MSKSETVPEQSLLASSYAAASYADCFSDFKPVKSKKNPAAIFQDMMYPLPGWIRGLMALRNWIVGFFGLKNTSPKDKDGWQNKKNLKVGGYIGFFKIESLTEKEVVLSANDRHLDSSFSLFLQEEGNGCRIYVTSVVTTKEWFGDAYMFVIAPFHRLIVTHLLNRCKLS